MAEFLINLVSLSSITTMGLYIWFNTDAFFEYIKSLDNFASLVTKENSELVIEFEKQKELSPSITFSQFLGMKYNNFLGRLISCPVCFGFWLNLISTLLFYSINYFAPSFLLSLVMYFNLAKLTNDN